MNNLVKRTAAGNHEANAADAPLSHQFLAFTLAGEMYAVGLLRVREIIGFAPLTEVPMMPPFIRGVINLRGAVVPVIDLAVRFGHQPCKIQRRTCIVIIEVHQDDDIQNIGIMVDAVSEVLDVAASDIENPPSFGARIRSDFIAGMCRSGDGFVIILEIQRVLSVDEMAMLVSVGETGGKTGGNLVV